MILHGVRRETSVVEKDPTDTTLLALLARCRSDHRAWINGDGAPYGLPDDGTIMGALGGCATGGRVTLERQVSVASQWTSGTGTVEFVNGGVEGDLAWLAMIERASVSLRGQAGTRRWDLRVTEVFRRTREGWERVHRQADPLVDRLDLGHVLALLEDHTP
jgi:ketosteroid isomerase-like protein